MSRIGRQPIAVPDGVKVHVSADQVRAEGPKGTLTCALVAGIEVRVDGANVIVTRQSDASEVRGKHGLVRKLIANMIQGVSAGFTRGLEIAGVGYRADVKGNVLMLSLGFSHAVYYQLPDGVTAKVDRQVSITLEGVDRQLLGEVAASIRRLRPPEPYKGKGIRYAEERIRRKAGKTAAGASG